jgi:UDP-3-O-[3-hydroxymyristoyl] glucosamine N-acyltransferase
MSLTLAELAQRFGLELKGRGDTVIDGVCALAPGRAGAIAFLANSKLRLQLAQTRAAAVIVGRRDAEALVTGLVAADPYLAYARVARCFDPHQAFSPGIHPSAVIGDGAQVGEACHVGPHVSVGAGAVIGAGCFIGPNCVIGEGVQIGADSRLIANVHVWHGVRIGARCHVQPGAVIGSRGFGNARGPQGWEEVPQLGSVVIGNDVEIGANTAIDRGAIDDTVIEDGVRLDNLIQVAHNVRIGAHTAIAAASGIAGSTVIGARCMIGGQVGIAGHLRIADDVVILARAMVTRSLERGMYGSGLPVSDARGWRRQVAGLRRLDGLFRRVRRIEQKLDLEGAADGGEGDGSDD